MKSEFTIKSIEKIFGVYRHEVNFIVPQGMVSGEIVLKEPLEFDMTYEMEVSEIM